MLETKRLRESGSECGAARCDLDLHSSQALASSATSIRVKSRTASRLIEGGSLKPL